MMRIRIQVDRKFFFGSGLRGKKLKKKIFLNKFSRLELDLFLTIRIHCSTGIHFV